MDNIDKHNKTVEAALSVMRTTFGEENIDRTAPVQMNNGLFQTHLLIKFPKLTVQNSARLSHTIYDLYVKFGILGTSLGDSLQGTRGKITQLEASVSYMHSHLPGSARHCFEYFCEGVGNFAAVQSKLQLDSWLDVDDNIKEDTLLIFEGWLFEMMGFLEWESLSGRPYKYIKNIGSGTNTDNVSPSDLHNSYLRFLKNIDFRELKVTYDQGFYKLEDDDAFEQALLRAASRFQFRTEDNVFYDTIQLPPTGLTSNFEVFVFKGSNVVQEVISSNIRQAQGEVYAHRRIKKHIYEQLSVAIRNAQKQVFSQYQAENIARRIARVRDTYAQREMLPENLVPVSGD